MRVLILQEKELLVAVGLENFIAVQDKTKEEVCKQFVRAYVGMEERRKEFPIKPIQAPKDYWIAWSEPDLTRHKVIGRKLLSFDGKKATYTDI